jgi:hypothetical protein
VHVWDCTDLAKVVALAVVPASTWGSDAEITAAQWLPSPRTDQPVTSKAWSMAPLLAIACASCLE